MIRRPPRATRTDTLFPYTTLVRSAICGGTPSAVTRAGTPPAEVKVIDYDPALSATLGGIAIAPERQKDILAALGFSVIEQGGRWQVSVPSWRRDMDGAPDVVEEVTRITGFDANAAVPVTRADGGETGETHVGNSATKAVIV